MTSGDDVRRVYQVPRTSGGAPGVWHDDPGCPQLYDYDEPELVSLPPQRARRSRLDRCGTCAGAEPHDDHADECPFCGKSVGSLPGHLPCPEQP